MVPRNVTTPDPPVIFLSSSQRDQVLRLLMLGLQAVEVPGAQTSERDWQTAMEKYVPLIELPQRTPQGLQVSVLERRNTPTRINLDRVACLH